MRYLLIAVCLFLAVNACAEQPAPEADVSGDSAAVASEPAPASAPSFAGADSVPSFSDDDSGEPSYDDQDEPSFGDEGDAEGE